MGLEFAGKTFGGYRVGDVLDSGSHGALYAAEHTSSGDKVAIKIFAVDLSRDKNAAQRLVSEVQRASAVTHPSVIQVREVGTAEFKGKRHLFVAMERLHGESLKSLIAKQKGQPLSLRQALHIVSEVGAALEAIHRSNGVHRQLTSSAVFVATGDGEPDESRITLLDLGAALVPTGDDKKAKTGGKVQDDLRALAQLAYEMLAGGDASIETSQAILPLRLRNRAVPARMDAVLRSVLSDALGTGDKSSRYDSAAAFVAALLGTGETQPVFASWSEDGRTLPAPRKSHSTLLWAGLFAIAGGLALGYHLYSNEPTTQPNGNPTQKPTMQIVDLAGPVPPPAGAADAGADAGPAQAPGPGHWPQRPGGKLPEVRAADPWPPIPTPQSPAASPAANPSTATPASPAGAKDTAATGQPSPAAKPAAATAAGTPTGSPVPTAKPTGAPPTGPAAPTAKPTGTPPTGASAPVANPAAKPTAPTAAPGEKATAPGVSAATAKPPAANPAGTTTAAPTAKPTGNAPAAQTAAVPAAKPATATPGAAAATNAAAKPTATSGTPGAATAPGAKPTAAAGTSATNPATAPNAAAKSPTGGAPTGASPTAAAKPAAPGSATPGATTPSTTAKPTAGSPATSAAGAAAPKSSSAPAASTGAASAAKTPETRPSSTGSSAPAAKPATNSGGASGPQ